MFFFLHERKHLRKSRACLSSVLLAYCLFSFAPFLLLHSHPSTDPHSSAEEKTHAHGWAFWSVHEQEHESTAEHHTPSDPLDEFTHSGEKELESETHADAPYEGHFGLEEQAWAMASSTGIAVLFFPPRITLLPISDPILPETALQLPSDPIPISQGLFSDGFPPFLTSDIPPPLLA